MLFTKGSIMKWFGVLLISLSLFTFNISCEKAELRKANRYSKNFKKGVESGIRKATVLQIKAGKYIKKNRKKYLHKIKRSL